MAFVHVLFLPYGQMEGFLRKLSDYISQIKVADHPTLHKRIRKIEARLSPVEIDKNMILVVANLSDK